MFNHKYLVSGKEDGSNNFERAYLTIGRNYIDEVLDKIRALVENCSNLKGFILYHSIGGATGSGFTALLLQRLNVEHPKKMFINHIVCPSRNFSDTVVEAYNAILGIDSIL